MSTAYYDPKLGKIVIIGEKKTEKDHPELSGRVGLDENIVEIDKESISIALKDWEAHNARCES